MNRPDLPLSVLFIALFVTVGAIVPWWPVWLTERGLDTAQIGLLLGLATLVRVIAAPVVAFAADRSGDLRQSLTLLAVIAALCHLGFAVVDGWWGLVAVTLLASAAWCGLVPLADTLSMRLLATRRHDYGRIRLWGSASFILAAFGLGSLIPWLGSAVILASMVGGLAAAALAARLLPTPDGPRPPPPALGAALALLGQRRFILLFLAAGAIQSSHGVLYGFSTLHWQAAGHSGALIGWLWTEGVLAEIALFALGARVARAMPAEWLLVLAGGLAILRWVGSGLTTELPALLILQLLHAATYACTHLATLRWMTEHSPPGLQATAQGLFSALALGVMSAVTMALAGRLYADWGGAAFFAMAGLAGLGMVAALALTRTRVARVMESD